MVHSNFNPLTKRGATDTRGFYTVVSGFKLFLHICNKLLVSSSVVAKRLAQWPSHYLVQLFFNQLLVKRSVFVLALDRQL